MADSFIQVAPDSTGKLIDNSSLTTGSGLVQRQRIALGDAVSPTNFAVIDSNGRVAVLQQFQAAAGDGSITTGGTAQNLFSGVAPVNGYAIYNPDPAEDLWISETTTAAPNGQGSIRIASNGGGYEMPVGVKPVGVVSIYGATTSHKFTARKW